jgi:zinc/manganese transport system permease protein
VFSSLIIPALATRRQGGPRRYAIAYGLGALGYALGLALSAVFDLPSGAVIVWTLAACGLVGAMTIPSSLDPLGPPNHAR